MHRSDHRTISSRFTAARTRCTRAAPTTWWRRPRRPSWTTTRTCRTWAITLLPPRCPRPPTSAVTTTNRAKTPRRAESGRRSTGKGISSRVRQAPAPSTPWSPTLFRSKICNSQKRIAPCEICHSSQEIWIITIRKRWAIWIRACSRL